MVEKLGCLGCSVKTRRLSISKPRESHPRAFLKQFSDAVVFSYDAGIQTFDTANASSMIATYNVPIPITTSGLFEWAFGNYSWKSHQAAESTQRRNCGHDEGIVSLNSGHSEQLFSYFCSQGLRCSGAGFWRKSEQPGQEPGRYRLCESAWARPQAHFPFCQAKSGALAVGLY